MSFGEVSGKDRRTRRATLPGGQRLALRPMAAADVEGVLHLHRGLTLDELYHRSHVVSRPRRADLERWVPVDGDGGYGLVAEVFEPWLEDGRTLGAAGYRPLGDRNGELAIVTAPEWRGWLGRLLLHAILREAAARGVANLETDILLSDQPTLALVRSRGCAFMPSDDPWSMRAVIGTHGTTPTWSGPHDRPRVLVEAPSGRWRAADAVAAAGCQLLVCAGPREQSCPALTAQGCPLAAAADAVVVAGPAHDGRWTALLEAHRSRHPGVALCVASSAPGDGETVAATGALRVPMGPGTDATATALIRRVALVHARRADGWSGDAPPPEAGAAPPSG